MKPRLFAAGLLVVVCSVGFQAQNQPPTTDPMIGTWKLNLANSTYSPGPPPKTIIDYRKYSILEGGWSVMVESIVNEVGNPAFNVQVYNFDGKQYEGHTAATLPLSLATGKKTNITRSFRLIDPYTVEFTTYTDGVAGIPATRVMSRDRKTMTQTTRGVNAQGVAINNVVVYEKVQ
jgi:hypothetical protein